jgi:hypothetical protein
MAEDATLTQSSITLPPPSGMNLISDPSNDTARIDANGPQQRRVVNVRHYSEPIDPSDAARAQVRSQALDQAWAQLLPIALWQERVRRAYEEPRGARPDVSADVVARLFEFYDLRRRGHMQNQPSMTEYFLMRAIQARTNARRSGGGVSYPSGSSLLQTQDAILFNAEDCSPH